MFQEVLKHYSRPPNPDDSDDAGSEEEMDSIDEPVEEPEEEEEIDPRKFFIVSNLGGRVLDVKRASTKPKAEVNMYDRKPEDSANQLFYQDDDGIIRSCLNRYTFDTSSGRLRLMPPNPGDPERQWTIEDNKLVNKNTGKILEVPKAKDQNNRRIEPNDYEGGDHQHWYIDYINE